MRERGITLIALVITIIVLLILAGVSISLVTGNNGVLTQGTNAVNKNREAAAREDLEMAWASATTDYWSDWATNSSTVLSDYRTKAKLDTYLIGKGTLEGNPKYNDTTKEYTVNYRAIDQNELYTFLITEDGKAKKKTGIILNKSETFIGVGESETLTVKFVEMEGNINDVEWDSNESSKITVTSSGEVSVLPGTAYGTTAKITATCNGKSDTCLVTASDKLAKAASVGDYADINIGYLDKKANNDFDDYTGNNIGIAWKVLSKNEETGDVNLISTGHPLQYYHSGTTATTSFENIQKISTEEIVVKDTLTEGYYNWCGFSTTNVIGLFSNKNVFKSIKSPGNSNDGLGITNDTPDNIRTTGRVYWLPTSNSSMYVVDGNGVVDTRFNGGYMYGNNGVRVVVSLSSDVRVKDGSGDNNAPFRLYGINY